MISNKFTVKQIQILRQIGFKETDLLVYLTLLRFKSEGTVVYDLIRHLKSNTKRTTLYSILTKLINLGAIEIVKDSPSVRNAKKYRAISPKKFFSNFIDQKQKELVQIEEIMHKLENFYQSGFDFQYLDLDNNIKPYIDYFQKKGWKLDFFSHTEKIPIYNCSVYDCKFVSPHTILYDKVIFHIFIFDYNITKDSIGLEFTLKNIKKEIDEYIRIYGNINKFITEDQTYSYANQQYSAYSVKTQTNILVDQYSLSNIRNFLQIGEDETIPKEIEIGLGVFIPIKNRIFFLWAETRKFIEEALNIILTLNGG